MTPCPPEEQLGRLLADDLSHPERSTVEAHVEQCSECQQALERLTEDSVVGQAGKAASPVRPALLRLRGEHPDQTPSAASNAGSTRVEGGDDVPDEVLLASLSPSSEPGSLGRLGEYEILGVVGRGGMGVVWKGFDPLLRRAVAVKVLAPHLTSSNSARKRFLREAQAAAMVAHENVVAIHAVHPGPPPHLVMQLITGITLEERLEQGPLAVEEILRIGRQTAAGLAAAHARRLVHRDVKPANILLSEAAAPHGTDGTKGTHGSHPSHPSHKFMVKITDFGLARAFDDAKITQSGVVAGTPLYMSPEQAEGEPVDHRSDLFSLGSVLYTMCTGRPAFRAANAMAVLKRVGAAAPQPVQEVNPEMPGWLAAVIQKLMAKDPAERFQSMAEVVEVFERGLAGAPHPFPEQVSAEATQAEEDVQARPRGRRRWLVAAGVGLLLLAGAAGGWFLPTLLGPHRLPPAVRRQPPEGQTPPTFKNRFGMEFVLVPRGKCWLGGGGDKLGDERVEIPYDFYLGKYEVTQEQWEAVTGKNPSYFSLSGEGKEMLQGVSADEVKQFPVESVSLDNVMTFISLLNQEETQTGWKYCLPLADEWEYACRGGPTTDSGSEGRAYHYYLARPVNQLLPGQANFAHAESPKRPCKVGSFSPNRLGLYDMHGNVSEWCHSNEKSPHGRPTPALRGGGWDSRPAHCRAASFEVQPPYFRSNALGVRVIRVFSGNQEK